jgi:hypothetical protein
MYKTPVHDIVHAMVEKRKPESKMAHLSDTRIQSIAHIGALLEAQI